MDKVRIGNDTTVLFTATRNGAPIAFGAVQELSTKLIDYGFSQRNGYRGNVELPCTHEVVDDAVVVKVLAADMAVGTYRLVVGWLENEQRYEVDNLAFEGVHFSDEVSIESANVQQVDLHLDTKVAEVHIGGEGGTTNYLQLTNKPQINSVELTGNLTLAQLGIQAQGQYATSTQLSSLATEVNKKLETVPAATPTTFGGFKYTFDAESGTLNLLTE